ncbi:MAG: hypothetical protein L0219_09360 [Phycisphaerales bacterium]|nr:hypothetical protein [Phycisphaerales bacterium]
MKNSSKSLQTCIAACLIGIGAAAGAAAAQEHNRDAAPDGGIAGGSCPGAGSCFVSHGTPGCDSEVCCSAVCDLDPFCCNAIWDSQCVDEAAKLCATCGGEGSPDCFTVHNFPTCGDPMCCSIVCTNDPFCCDTEWDALCVQGAFDHCTCGGAQTGSCFTSHGTPWCDLDDCCAAVCNVDPFCCELNWDNLCVTEANQLCTTCGGPGAGNCLAAHPNTYCNNADCCQWICAIDPFCCGVTWDDKCALEALEMCATCGQGGSDSCFVEHYIPACENSTCCNTVCAADPFCCNSQWDSICVSEANALCCPADIAPSGGDGQVDVSDLLMIITKWGQCPIGVCVGDITPPGGDDTVNIDDLLAVITAWGACP